MNTSSIKRLRSNLVSAYINLHEICSYLTKEEQNRDLSLFSVFTKHRHKLRLLCIKPRCEFNSSFHNNWIGHWIETNIFLIIPFFYRLQVEFAIEHKILHWLKVISLFHFFFVLTLYRTLNGILKLNISPKALLVGLF